ncbi:MAG: hypothetical protein H5U36_05320 [Candidatus Caldatribacterium sp.]|nr:hypothetical protein [Candidatus Caldatribacterium sp.]
MARWILLGVLFSSLFLSGCRIGVGVGLEVRLGYVTFRSQDAALEGPFFLDGVRVGYLPPLGTLRCLVTLDFPHEVRVLASSCPGGVCVFRIEPPLHPGEVISLSLSQAQ